MDEKNSKDVENEFYIMRVLISDGTTLFDILGTRVRLSSFQHPVVLYSLANINSFQIFMMKDF